MIIGMEKGQSIIALMDNDEIKAVVAAIRSLTVLTQESKASVWTEFEELGYNDQMNPSEVLTSMRFLFNGSKISNKG
jgi:flagellar motor switch protein FliG